MKVGDAVEVNIGQAVVQRGKIVEIDNESSTATIVIPATKVVMSFKTQLDTVPVAPAQGNEHAILGVENRQSETPADTSTASVVENPDVSSGTVETPAPAVEAPAPVEQEVATDATQTVAVEPAPVVETDA